MIAYLHDHDLFMQANHHVWVSQHWKKVAIHHVLKRRQLFCLLCYCHMSSAPFNVQAQHRISLSLFPCFLPEKCFKACVMVGYACKNRFRVLAPVFKASLFPLFLQTCIDPQLGLGLALLANIEPWKHRHISHSCATPPHPPSPLHLYNWSNLQLNREFVFVFCVCMSAVVFIANFKTLGYTDRVYLFFYMGNVFH